MTIVVLANPRSGSQIAKKFLDENDDEITKLFILGGKTVACKMHLFDLSNKNHQKKYFKLFE